MKMKLAHLLRKAIPHHLLDDGWGKSASTSVVCPWQLLPIRGDTQALTTSFALIRTLHLDIWRVWKVSTPKLRFTLRWAVLPEPAFCFITGRTLLPIRERSKASPMTMFYPGFGGSFQGVALGTNKGQWPLKEKWARKLLTPRFLSCDASIVTTASSHLESGIHTYQR